LELLLLTGYLFNAIKKRWSADDEVDHYSLGRSRLEPGITLSITYSRVLNVIKDYIQREVGTIRDNLTKQENPSSRRMKTVVKLVNLLQPRSKVVRGRTSNIQVLSDFAFHSELANCLDSDDMRFLRSVVQNAAFDSPDGCYATLTEELDELLINWSQRPRQLKSSDYDVREHRRDVKELSVLVSALSESKEIFPLLERDFNELLSFFTKTG
jgi:hypothetical protein